MLLIYNINPSQMKTSMDASIYTFLFKFLPSGPGVIWSRISFNPILPMFLCGPRLNISDFGKQLSNHIDWCSQFADK